MASKEELLSLEGCASFLSLPKATIYRKVRKNEIPYMKRGGRLYFSRTQLLELNNMTKKQEINNGLEAANRLNGVIIEHYLPHIKLSLARIADALEQRNRILKNKGE